MIITNFLVGLPVMLLCLALQASVTFWCVRYQQFPISRHALFLGGMRESAFVNFLEQSPDAAGGWPCYGGPPADG